MGSVWLNLYTVPSTPLVSYLFPPTALLNPLLIPQVYTPPPKGVACGEGRQSLSKNFPLLCQRRGNEGEDLKSTGG